MNNFCTEETYMVYEERTTKVAIIKMKRLVGYAGQRIGESKRPGPSTCRYGRRCPWHARGACWFLHEGKLDFMEPNWTSVEEPSSVASAVADLRQMMADYVQETQKEIGEIKAMIEKRRRRRKRRSPASTTEPEQFSLGTEPEISEEAVREDSPEQQQQQELRQQPEQLQLEQQQEKKWDPLEDQNEMVDQELVPTQAKEPPDKELEREERKKEDDEAYEIALKELMKVGCLTEKQAHEILTSSPAYTIEEWNEKGRGKDRGKAKNKNPNKGYGKSAQRPGFTPRRKA
jgi:hypothetical protein